MKVTKAATPSNVASRLSLAEALRRVDPLADAERVSIQHFADFLLDLRTMREQVGITQGEVAERMRTSQSVVSELESGTSDPRLSTIRRYAAALGQCVRCVGYQFGSDLPQHPVV